MDNEQKTLNVAKEVLKDYADRLEFRQADILQALKNQRDNSIDIFASALTLHNLSPDYRLKVFNEIARVLKRGGMFVNGDKYAREDPTLHKKDFDEQTRAYDIYDTIGRSDYKEQWVSHDREDEKIKITDAEQIKILEGLGFKDIHIAFRRGMHAIICAIK